MISKYSGITTDLAEELAKSMQTSLTKTASDVNLDNKIEETILNLNKSAQLFDELKNYKAAEIITKVIEKLASTSGK